MNQYFCFHCFAATVANVFGSSLAFVQHSVTADDGDMEGTPVAILEAQAAGLPVVSTFHAGIPDVVQQNVTGLLVAEFDEAGMAAQMRRLLDQPDLAHALGSAGRKRLREHFSLEHHLTTLNNILNSAVNG